MQVATALLATSLALFVSFDRAQAQSTFGTDCPGASGVTPTIATAHPVFYGEDWTLEVTASGGLGLGLLLVGFSGSTATSLGGQALPLDLGVFFGDALWSGCPLNVDPSYTIQPYTFDPTVDGGLVSFDFPGLASGRVFVQALNLDPDFTSAIAGASRGLEVAPKDLVDGMVAIPAGTFEMGSDVPLGAPYFPQSNEQPVHRVTISQPFWMARHEVTQAEFEAVMGSNPSHFSGATLPVESVSWFDAVAYCEALTAQQSAAGNVPEGYEYRLPTEAEWEYACRAGTKTEFNVGDELFCSEARIALSFHSDSSCNNPLGPADVETFAPNAWGLFDMHGNVWEWCLDNVTNYPDEPVTDPFATGGASRVLRGGSWFDYSNDSRSAARFGSDPAVTSNQFIGFRVVLAPVLEP